MKLRTRYVQFSLKQDGIIVHVAYMTRSVPLRYIGNVLQVRKVNRV